MKTTGISILKTLQNNLMLSPGGKTALNIDTLKYVPKSIELFKKTYTKITKLRSMQHIKGAEREIIEAYRKELSHDIWGNPEKLKVWADKKFSELTERNYKSFMLDEKVIARDRNEAVKEWVKLINENTICQNNPYLKLKILRSVVENLKENNMQLAPIINKKAFADAVYEINKTGASFKKTYFKLIREFDTSVNAKTEEIAENGIRGKWFSIKVPDSRDAEHSPGLFNRIKEFISVLSQGSNWCTRTPNAVSKNFMGCDFHIFIDRKGYPQLCLVGNDKNGGWFKYIRGNDQYAPIDKEYKSILKSYIERHNLNDAVVGRSETNTANILDLLD